MTPEQKEAFRREVQEEAAKVADHCHATGVMGAQVVADAIEAYAASQPAREMTGFLSTLSDEQRVTALGYDGPDTPAADVQKQRLADAQARQRGENLDGSPRRETVPAADTGQAAAWPDEATVDRAYAATLRVLPAHADLGVGEIDKMVRAALVAATHPAPLDAERVRELETAVRRSQRALMSLPVTSLEIADCIETNRAALRQKEGK